MKFSKNQQKRDRKQMTKDLELWQKLIIYVDFIFTSL